MIERERGRERRKKEWREEGGRTSSCLSVHHPCVPPAKRRATTREKTQANGQFACANNLPTGRIEAWIWLIGSPGFGEQIQSSRPARGTAVDGASLIPKLWARACLTTCNLDQGAMDIMDTWKLWKMDCGCGCGLFCL